MKPEDAAPLVRRWFDQHGRSVAMALARLGVRTAADRADLKQEVFTTAFLALLRGETIDIPGAWLNECARKKASNHRRKESRRASPAGEEAGEEVVGTMASPAQLAEDREALCFAFECLDQESQDIVLAVRADGLSWDDIADERGIKVDRARYLFTMAVTQMDVALKREDSRTNTHRSVAFPILLAQVFDAIRAEVDSDPPELDLRVREGLDRFMESAGAGAPDPESERVSVARPSPISTPITPPPAAAMTVGPVLGILGGGVVVGIVIGYLLHGALPDKPSPEPGRARSIPIVAEAEPSARIRDAEAAKLLLPANGSTTVPVDLLPQSRQGAKSGTPRDALRGASTRESLMLIDGARAAFRAGNAREALALLAEHARRFPERLDEGDRPELLHVVCAASSVRDATECAVVRSGNAAN
jgi:DNA-directed RNA polymerase specialized sigma24 family protein